MAGVRELVAVIIHVTIALVAFTVGTNAASPPSAGRGRRRALLIRSLVGVLLVMPLLTVVVLRSASLSSEVATGLLVSMIAVGPVTALHKSSKDGAGVSFALALNLALLAASVLFVPLAAWLIGAAYQRQVHLRPALVARVILPLQLLPLVAGVAIARWAPRWAARVSKPLTIVTNLVLAAVLVLALVVFFRPLLGVGGRGFLVAGVLSAAAVLVAHVLGGPDGTDRKVLGAFMALRFPALALALAKVSASGRRAVPAVLAYVICSGIAYAIYAAWIARAATRAPHPPDSRPRPLPAS
jgi:BASS family bile acid:Na+ symporter